MSEDTKFSQKLTVTKNTKTCLETLAKIAQWVRDRPPEQVEITKVIGKPDWIPPIDVDSIYANLTLIMGNYDGML